MVALLLFIMSYFCFWPKKLLNGKGTFDDNVFKNPARYIQQKRKPWDWTEFLVNF